MTDSRRNPWLDLVRCVAIGLVLLRHGERAVADAQGAPDALQTLFLNGWIGVDLFFVLSGYLIAKHLIGAGIGTPRFQAWRYLALRALRIMPAYVAVMALVIGGLFPFYAIDRGDLPARIAYHLLFLQDYLPSNINIVFWSLGVEEKFYLAAPLLMVALLKLRGGRSGILLVALFVAPGVFRAFAWQGAGRDFDYATFFPAFRSPFHMTWEGLVAGVAIAAGERARLIRRSALRGAAWLGASAIVLLAWMSTHDFMAEITAFDATVQPILIAALAGALTLGAVMLGGTAMPLANATRWLARLSYCLYLVHLPLIPLAIALAAGAEPGFWLAYSSTSIVAATVLHLAVERPFLDWKERLAAPRGSDNPPPPLAGGSAAALRRGLGRFRPAPDRAA